MSKDHTKEIKRCFLRPLCLFAAILPLCLFSFACQTQGPKAEPLSQPPKVTQIDVSGLEDVLKPNGKPRLINFWATWCGPCIEEFPDLVNIGKEYKDKFELVTISLDEPAELNSSVPKFLAEMGSDSPAYLLKTPDADAAIALVSKDWQGALPFTILINNQGETVYSKQGKFDPDVLQAETEKF